MVGFARFIAIVMLVLSGILVVACIGTASEFRGYEQDIVITSMIAAIPMLAGMATIVWNVATVAEEARKRTAETALTK